MDYLKIFTDFARSMERLNDAERGRLFSAMLAYADRGELPDLPGNERFVWPTAQLHIDREAEAIAKKRECGALGGRRRSSAENQTKPTVTTENQTKPTVTTGNQTKPAVTTGNQTKPTVTSKDKDKDKDKDNSSSPGGEDVPRPRGPYANVYLTDRELTLFRDEYTDAERHIEKMGEYLASTGRTYANYLAALRRWAKKEEAERPPPGDRQNLQDRGGGRLRRAARQDHGEDRNDWMIRYIRRDGPVRPGDAEALRQPERQCDHTKEDTS